MHQLEAYLLAGQVTSADGSGIPATVMIGDDRDHRQMVETDAEGRFEAVAKYGGCHLHTRGSCMVYFPTRIEISVTDRHGKSATVTIPTDRPDRGGVFPYRVDIQLPRDPALTP